MRRRKTAHDEIGFNITPMIDMTFLLLIFFMVTSKLSKEQKKMDIALPVASAAVLPEDISNRDIVNVDATGAWWVSGRTFADDEMAAYLKDRFKSNPPLKIYLRADKLTPAKRIRQFMTMATDAGAANVIFGTHQK